MTNLILPTHVAKARAKQVKKEQKKKEESKLPEPTGWRILILPHQGKGKTKGLMNQLNQMPDSEAKDRLMQYVNC